MTDVALKSQIKTDMTAAMKSGDKSKVMVLRSVLAAITKAETNGKKRHDLTDTEVQAVLRKEAKTRRDSADIFKQAGAQDRADTERAEAEIIENYLPQMLDESATITLVADIINANHLALLGKRGVGQVMAALKDRSDVDKSLAAKIANKILVY